MRKAKDCLPKMPPQPASVLASLDAASSSGLVRGADDGSDLTGLAESEASVDRRLLSYYLASRRAAASCSTIGFAVDAGRVSKRGTFVGVFTTPENLAFWAPPQVLPSWFAVGAFVCLASSATFMDRSLGYEGLLPGSNPADLFHYRLVFTAAVLNIGLFWCGVVVLAPPPPTSPPLSIERKSASR